MLQKFFLIVQIARLCHEANREYCISIGDNSQPTWEDAPYWQKLSVVKGVLLHLYFYPAISPEQGHKARMQRMLDDGWKYGEKKNLKTKEHPSLVPWGDLSVEQRVKYTLFIHIVHAFVNAMGKEYIQQNLIDSGNLDEKDEPIFIPEVEPNPALLKELKKLDKKETEKPEDKKPEKEVVVQEKDKEPVGGIATDQSIPGSFDKGDTYFDQKHVVDDPDHDLNTPIKQKDIEPQVDGSVSDDPTAGEGLNEGAANDPTFNLGNEYSEKNAEDVKKDKPGKGTPPGIR